VVRRIISTIRRTTESGGIEHEIASRYRCGIANVRIRALLNMPSRSYEREVEEGERSAERRNW
jgi:hypothetical protein